MKSPNAKKIPKMPKQHRMTLDRLALMIQQEFMNIYDRFNEMEKQFDDRFYVIDRDLKDLKYTMVEMRTDMNRFNSRITLLEQKAGV